MIFLELTYQERLQFSNILPTKGSLDTLTLVENILKKVKIENVKDVQSKDLLKIEFETEEIDFLIEIINFLNSNGQLNFASLSLIRKILNIKEK
jgi:hypothetical protein